MHAVSVGEINAVREFVRVLAASAAAPEIVIASTTDTGVARARSEFGDDHSVVRYPFDFAFAVTSFLGRVRPDAVVLVELEVWPNFTRACALRNIPIGVINGRLSVRSARRYRLVGPLVRPSFRRLAFAAVQHEADAARFRTVGVPSDRVHVTGTMKWDTARITDRVDGADRLAADLGIDRDRPLVVAGSTAPEEHRLLHESIPPGVQLLCAPRKPEWFDAAAAAFPGCARRARGDRGSATDRFVLDTIGELRAAYALADVVVIGRSFGSRHGSDMIEPIGLGKPTIVGPAVDDFSVISDDLLTAGGLIQTDAEGLAGAIAEIVDDPQRARTLARNGREVIRRRQGATARNVDLALSLVDGVGRAAASG